MADDARREPEHRVKRLMDQLRRFWSHPAVQIGQWVVALLLGGLIGYFVAIWAEKKRELTYQVNPTRAVIVKAGEASALQVSHGGRPVTTDVSAVQVQVWNEGRESIRQNNMHEPLIISTADGTPILEATVRQQNRPTIVRLALDDAQKDQGRIGVSWNILEHRDGGIIQLIIAGKPDVKVKAEAALEGQRQIREVALHPIKKEEVVVPLIGAVTMPVTSIAILLVGVIGRQRLAGAIGRKPRRKISGVELMLIVGSFAIFGWSLYELLSAFLSTPPLAF
jgi:hypothetical protein